MKTVCVMLVLGMCAKGIAAQERGFDLASLAALEGTWNGELEYLDYQDNTTRVRLPTTLEIRPSLLGDRVTLNYVYQDPGFRVEAFIVVTYDAESGRLAMTSLDGAESESSSWTIGEFEPSATPRSRTRLQLVRPGWDDERPALIRETWVWEGDGLRVLKEVQHAGTRFTFRNELQLQRSRPPEAERTINAGIE